MVGPWLSCSALAQVVVTLPQPGARFGAAVAAGGDVDGDGRSDLLVGAPYLTSPSHRREGGVFLVPGGGASPPWSVRSGVRDAELGAAVAFAGDVNGDGYDDVLVGAPAWSHGTDREGAVALFLGGPGGLGPSPSWWVEGESTIAFLGQAVAGAGDVNGDGYDDVLVGAPGFAGHGRVQLFLGAAAGLGASAAWTLDGAMYGEDVGTGLAGVGDVNGDGYDDVAVGSPGYVLYVGEVDRGRARLFLGGPAGLSSAPAWEAVGEQPLRGFGSVVASAGDVDGDGHLDVVVASPQADVLGGRVWLFRGGAAGLETAPTTTFTPGLGPVEFATSVVAADLDGDGYDDLVVGAPRWSGPEGWEGAAFVHRGSPAGWETVASRVIQSDVSWGRLGSALAAAGDVDGDGFEDVVAGAPGWPSTGSVWWVPGQP